MNPRYCRRTLAVLLLAFELFLLWKTPLFADDSYHEMMRQRMVEIQIRNRGVASEPVLKALSAVPRHLFIPEAFRDRAYDDGPVPIGFDQTISQPYIVAYMTELLQVNPGDKVLEIGTGSGYQTAVLAELGAVIFTVEIVEPLARQAMHVLSTAGYHHIEFRVGDGWQGWADQAPFDRIIVTAAPDIIPQALVDQLVEGGRMVIPVGEHLQQLIVGAKENGIFKTVETVPVRFVPLVRGKD